MGIITVEDLSNLCVLIFSLWFVHEKHSPVRKTFFNLEKLYGWKRGLLLQILLKIPNDFNKVGIN